ncbi:asparagine synthase-related protein [Nostoc sp. LEGE 12450]|uniref:asparagine synthase-related protein n=1 Tax=Nostoc sp. LEGE 12450 TaxID=1828643 RepID=UPI00188283A8|nr:asparagine synthase-related protein [Nostoc sp. LEGE 12450]MBE8990359.1 asparagine synthase [Nostoc sp. LEGE 12450]
MRVGFDVFSALNEDTQFHVFSCHRDDVKQAPLVTFARDRQSGIAAILLGHLCYQDEILLKLPQSMRQSCASDAAITIMVYCHNGFKGLEELEGEFSLVLWDGASQRLFALRDPLGSWPLFWLVNSQRIAVSTSLRSLLALLPERSLDLDFMAQFIMWPTLGVELPIERTPFKQIKRVLPGTTLEMNPTGQVKSHRWWNWTTKLDKNNNITLEEAGEQYANLLRQAVKQRVQRGRIAAHLSGGMDSSSIVCIAREWILSAVGRSPLHTLSEVYKRPCLIGERAYIEMVIEQGGPVEAHFIDSDNALDFLWFNEEIPTHDEPYPCLAQFGMEKILIEAAHQVGVDTILTGIGSDQLLASKRLYIADFLRQGRWLAALLEAKRWACAKNQDVWSILYRCGIQPAWPILTGEGFGYFLRHGFGRWPALGAFSIPPWVIPDFARSYQMQSIGIQNAHTLYHSPAEIAADLWAIQGSVGDWSSWYLAAPRGMHNSRPFLDPRLLSFCLGLPRSIREIPGMPKPVLQTAMQGVLPEAVRTRKDKRSFNDNYCLGLSKHLLQLETMVQTSGIRELGIFDQSQLIRFMHQAAVGIGDMPTCGRINITLSLIAWFEQMTETWHQPLEKPTEIHHLNYLLQI